MNNRLYKLMNWPRIEGIIYSEEDRPHEILGPHIVGKSVLFQTFQPGAGKVSLITEDGKKTEMEMVDEAGYFAALVAGKIPDRYEYEICRGEETVLQKDAYRYQIGLSAKDIEKFNAGIHYTIYEKLGAHFMTIDGTEGTFFAVWAPNALRVSVVGDFNHWDGRLHQMTRNPEGGIFEIFIPDVKPGECYKFELKVKGGLTYLKADPYAFGQQLRPDTASVVRDFQYVWKDGKWMKDREKRQQENAPVSVYEMYLGSFKRNRETNDYLNYRELAPEIAKYAKEMGYTHVELMPVMEHPLDASWGYQVIGYYAPTARYGTAEDFMFLVDTLHQAGIGVILDWVPAHFPRDTFGLAAFDGTCLYEHWDPRQGSHPHWGTLIYNYGRPQVKNFLIANALFWTEVYHADGIRMDAVASMLYLDYGKNDGEWVANIYGGKENLEAVEFLKHLNSIFKKRRDGALLIAEESTAWPKVTGAVEEEGLGFDFKWNMGWMNDFIGYMHYDPVFRAYHHGELTFSMIYAYSESFILSLSHDEVVHGKASLVGKMPGDRDSQLNNLRAAYGYMMAHPGKKLLFMGQEFAPFEEWNENVGLDWELLQYQDHSNMRDYVKALNTFLREHPALYEQDHEPEGFEWINNISANENMLVFLRKAKKGRETLLIVCNFSPLVYEKHKIGVPFEGRYKEIFNSDSEEFGGSSVRNKRAKLSKKSECDGRENSIEITVPPMGIAVFTCTPEKVPVKKGRAGKTEKLIKTEKPELSAGEKKVSKTARAEAKKETKAAEKKPAAKNK